MAEYWLKWQLERSQGGEILVVYFYYKLDGVAPLVADPPQCNSTTMHSRLVFQDRNVCRGETPFLFVPAKPPYLLNQ